VKTLGKLIVILLVVGSTTAMAAREIKTADFSGWMDNYDTLTYNEERNAFLFFNEEKRGTYHQAMLESAVLYTKNAKAETKIATKATDYMAAGVSDLLERKGLLATEAGPKVMRLRIAITGAEKSKEDLKAYNFVPVSALFRGAQAATGKVATYIDTSFEGVMVDSMTGEPVAAIVAKGIEETEKRSGDSLSFEDIQPTLDKWIEQLGRTLDEYLAKREGS